MDPHGFLAPPPPSQAVDRLHEEDRAEVGYVMNLTHAWGHRPDLQDGLFELARQAVGPLELDLRRRGVLVAACASAFGDSYCSLAWGTRLAGAADPDTAAAVLRGEDTGLSPAERAMAGWARAVARDPSRTTAADVRSLREAGLTDAEIVGITVFVALRLAFATVNGALGALPDAALRTTAPPAVLDAVTFGRPVADAAPE